MNSWAKYARTIYWYDQYALNESETAFSKYDPDRIIEDCYYLEKSLIMGRFRLTILGPEVDKFLLGGRNAQTTMNNLIKQTQKLIDESIDKD